MSRGQKVNFENATRTKSPFRMYVAIKIPLYQGLLTLLYWVNLKLYFNNLHLIYKYIFY